VKNRADFDKLVNFWERMCVFSRPSDDVAMNNGLVNLDDGVIFSAKTFLENIQLTKAAMDCKITLHVYETSPVSNNGWVLIMLATHSVTVTSKGVHHTPRPILFCWTRSKNGDAVRAMLECLHKIARLYYEIPKLHVSAVLLDDCDAFYNSVTQDETNGTVVVSCFARMLRNVGKCSEFLDFKVNKKQVNENLQALRNAQSLECFERASYLAVEHWKMMGECTFVNYFCVRYLNFNNNAWYIGASGMRELGNTVNCMESLNSIIKESMFESSSVDEAMRNGLPALLCTLSNCNEISRVPVIRDCLQNQLMLIKTQPVPLSILKRAKVITAARDPVQWKQCRLTESMYINASTSHKEVVTQERINAYIQLVQHGITPELTTAKESWDKCADIMTSLHEVREFTTECGKLVFLCDCSIFAQSGYCCAHSLAARHMHKSHTINLMNLVGNRMNRRKKTSNAILWLQHEEQSVDHVAAAAFEPMVSDVINISNSLIDDDPPVSHIKSLIEKHLLHDIRCGRNVYTLIAWGSKDVANKRQSIYSAFCCDIGGSEEAELLQKRVWDSLRDEMKYQQKTQNHSCMMAETNQRMLTYFQNINNTEDDSWRSTDENGETTSELDTEDFIAAYTMDQGDGDCAEVPCNALLELFRLATLTSTTLYVHWYQTSYKNTVSCYDITKIIDKEHKNEMHLVCFEDKFTRCHVERLSDVLMRECECVKIPCPSSDIWSIIALCLMKIGEKDADYAAECDINTIATGALLKQALCQCMLDKPKGEADQVEEQWNFLGDRSIFTYFCNTNGLPVNEESREVMRIAYSASNLNLDGYCGLLPLYVTCMKYHVKIIMRGCPLYKDPNDPMSFKFDGEVEVKHDSWQRLPLLYDPHEFDDSDDGHCLCLLHDESTDFIGVKEGRWTKATHWLGGIAADI